MLILLLACTGPNSESSTSQTASFVHIQEGECRNADDQGELTATLLDPASTAIVTTKNMSGDVGWVSAPQYRYISNTQIVFKCAGDTWRVTEISQ